MSTMLPSDPTLLTALLNDPDRIAPIVDRLKANGYRPVPMRGGRKFSDTDDLPRWGREPMPTATFIDEIKAGRGGSIGIVCSTVVAVDLDIEDPMAVRVMEMAARDILGETPLRRVGRAPRSALIYRPVRVIAQGELTGFAGTDVRVDGLIFAAFGVHPRTRRPYDWGNASPLDIPVADLPAVDVPRLQEFLSAIGVLMW